MQDRRRTWVWAVSCVAVVVSHIAAWHTIRSLRDDVAALWERQPAHERSADATAHEADHDAFRSAIARLDTRIDELASRASTEGDSTDDADYPALVDRVGRLEATVDAHGLRPPEELNDDQLYRLADKARTGDPESGVPLFDMLLDRDLPAELRRRAIHGGMRSASAAKDALGLRRYVDALAAEPDLTEKDRQDVALFDAIALEIAGDIDGAVDAYLAAAEQFPDTYLEANAYWNLAVLLLPSKPELSMVYFRLIVETFAGTGIADDIVERATLELSKLT